MSGIASSTSRMGAFEVMAMRITSVMMPMVASMPMKMQNIAITAIVVGSMGVPLCSFGSVFGR
ncbi:MAG: hypothetical protein GYB20_20155 [Oceanospirillales bacterium]|nr:hypothetical protein [Oceanospirillales bacterium]